MEQLYTEEEELVFSETMETDWAALGAEAVTVWETDDSDRENAQNWK